MFAPPPFVETVLSLGVVVANVVLFLGCTLCRGIIPQLHTVPRNSTKLSVLYIRRFPVRMNRC